MKKELEQEEHKTYKSIEPVMQKSNARKNTVLTRERK